MIVDDCALAVRPLVRTDPTWRTSTHRAAEVSGVYVRVRCGDVVGIGASSAHPRIAPLPVLVEALRDVLLPAVTGRELGHARTVPDRWRRDLPTRAVIALDLAIWDLLGKLAGVPCETLWGGHQHDELTVVRMVGLKEPDDVVAAVGELTAVGVRAVKIKVGDGVSRDLERIRRVREAFGDDLAIQVDANSAYDVSQGIELGRGLGAFDVGLLEQPVRGDDRAGMRQVTQASPTPVMIDQGVANAREAVEICREGIADAISIKLTKMGTIGECLRVLAVCDAFGVAAHLGGTAAPSLVDSAACRFATAQLGLSSVVEVGESAGLVGEVTTGFELSGGTVRSDGRPGLGSADVFDEAGSSPRQLEMITIGE